MVYFQLKCHSVAIFIFEVDLECKSMLCGCLVCLIQVGVAAGLAVLFIKVLKKRAGVVDDIVKLGKQL